MDFVYFIENTTGDFNDNSGVFNLIQDLNIDDNEVYTDSGTDKQELEKLLNALDAGDRLIIRSVVDLSETAKGLLDILSDLQDREIQLCSVSEVFLNGTDYYTAMKGFLEIHWVYREKKRLNAYTLAKEQGKVGRPPNPNIDKAIKLYNLKFSLREIEDLTGVPSSTLYRALKDSKKKE
ncbi:MAG TPA: recombinase family protein [Clostridiales bacterium]|nr:recombinase family protein [Clostridiales bacterium]